MMTPTSQAYDRICGARMHSLNGRLRTIVWVLALLVTSSLYTHKTKLAVPPLTGRPSSRIGFPSMAIETGS